MEKSKHPQIWLAFFFASSALRIIQYAMIPYGERKKLIKYSIVIIDRNNEFKLVSCHRNQKIQIKFLFYFYFRCNAQFIFLPIVLLVLDSNTWVESSGGDFSFTSYEWLEAVLILFIAGSGFGAAIVQPGILTKMILE
jgi:hypothetical protein